MDEQPKRHLGEGDLRTYRPIGAVWEITLACDLKCNHCGSRAGPARPKELTTAECLDVVRQLASLGCREVTLIGGEAYLRPDWTEIVRGIRDHGMNCSLTTGGRNLTEERVKAAAAAGLQSASVSIDGLEATHDRIRGVKGSFRAAFESMARLRQHGIILCNNTQISALSLREMPELMERLIAAGSLHWQLQLTVAMGNAVDHDELLLQPYQLLELMPMLAELYKSAARRGFSIEPGNNIGYFGPYESLWRGGPGQNEHWIGCNAGQNTIGLEADGNIKGCPSLATRDFTGGNIREMSLEQIWAQTPQLAFTRKRTIDDLWGFCRGCYYADVCRGGCTWTTHSMFGRAGNNPYCHHRALELAKQGKRERVVKVQDAPGESFDRGLFELIEEPLDAPVPVESRELPEPTVRHAFPR
jgi:Y-X(10)_GDL-associated radical SAM protein